MLQQVRHRLTRERVVLHAPEALLADWQAFAGAIHLLADWQALASTYNVSAYGSMISAWL